MNRDDTILDELESLLAAPSWTGDDDALARIEETLTAGYARALALEAERLRLEQQLGVAAATLGDGAPAERADEVAELAQRMSRASGDLDRLRGLLGALRTRTRSLRTTLPPAAA